MQQFLQVGSKCPTCSKIIGKTKNSHYLRIQLFDVNGSGSSKTVVHSELKKNLMESNHKVIVLQLELSDTKNKLNQSRANQEAALNQIRSNEDMMRAPEESIQSLKTDCQQATNARDDYLVDLKSVQLCNQTLINELKESQKSYKSVSKELLSKKGKCSTCKKKPLNSINPASTSQVSDNHDYRSKYLNLRKQHNDLLKKEQILEKKFVELIVNANSPNVAHGITNPVSYHHQVNGSVPRENKLLIDISRLKQSKDKMFKEKRTFQDKYNATNTQLKDMQVHKEPLLGEIKVMQDQLKASDESNALLQLGKQNWESENCSTKENLKVSLENTKKLQELNQRYERGTFVLHLQTLASEQIMQAFHENELLEPKELDNFKSVLETVKITSENLTSEIVALKEKLAIATRCWF